MKFEKLFKEINYITTMYGNKPKLRILHQVCKEIKNIPGNVVEIGAFRGGTSRFIAKLLPHKKVYVFDTFKGMPPKWDHLKGETYFDTNSFKSSWTEHKQLVEKCINQCNNKKLKNNMKKGLDECKKTLNTLDDGIDLYPFVKSYLEDCPNIEIRRGMFPEVIGTQFKKEKFCFMHFDGDLYNSCAYSIQLVKPRLSDKGVMLFDDFNSSNCPGIKICMEEYFGEQFEDIGEGYAKFTA